MAAGTVSGCWSHWQSEHILAVVFLGRSGISPLPNCKDSHCDTLWYSNVFYDALHSDEPHLEATQRLSRSKADIMGLAGAGLPHQVECTLGFHMIVSYEESEDTVAAVAVRRFKAYRHASFFSHR